MLLVLIGWVRLVVVGLRLVRFVGVLVVGGKIGSCVLVILVVSVEVLCCDLVCGLCWLVCLGVVIGCLIKS